ncbi:MAG: ATP-binding protein [Bacteriovorax sp.]|nr:ATP-binding protein [Bacteriovorax sp.]
MEKNLQLSAEQRKFEAIFYGSETSMVLFLGLEFVYEMYNEKYQELYPSRDLLGKPFAEAVPELKESAFPGILKKVYETGEPFYSREGLAHICNPINGQLEERYFDTTFSRIDFGDNGPYRILANPREVTDRVLLRKKLEASVWELEQERELRERFVSSLSHDLRTPLTLAKINTQILKRKAEDAKVVISMAEKIVVNMDRVDRMIHDMLDANRIKISEGIPISIQECRLDLIISSVVENLEELYGKRFKIQNDAGEVSGFWDCDAIHRLIENLASNAIKYGSPETPVVIGLTQQNNWIEISVHNKGETISLEDQQSLFNHYRRTNFATTSGQKGWGIGLALVKALTEAHGGEVRVESQMEFGTTFFIRLPLDARHTKIPLFKKGNV